MQYYIVDDNLATVKSLENIIRTKELGTVCGYSTDPMTAYEEILEDSPDIVLVDLLMAGMDGITLVEKVREKKTGISFVMISKVTDKEMVGRAYTAGIEFFINKPVNIVEVERVLANVSEKRRMEGIMGNIRSMIDVAGENGTGEPENRSSGNDIDLLLGTIGMLGEKGTSDIRMVFREMLRQGKNYDKDIVEKVAEDSGDSVRNIEQRIRRAVKKGLTNAAAIGLEDYDSEAFTVYAGYVFDYRTLRDEMNLLKGTADTGGRVSIAGFFEGLLLYYNSK